MATNAKPKVCPIMSYRLVGAGPPSAIAPNINTAAPVTVDCARERCAMAFTDEDGEFISCGLSVAVDIDQVQARLTELRDVVSGVRTRLGALVRMSQDYHQKTFPEKHLEDEK